MRHYNIFILNIFTYIFSIYGNNIAYKKNDPQHLDFFSLFFYGNGELIDLLDCVNIRIYVLFNILFLLICYMLPYLCFEKETKII